MNLIVWINGPFGVGKTTVAERLAVLWPTALVFDPECVGTMLRRLIPLELQSDDYQDMPIWRRLVRTTAIGLLADWVKVKNRDYWRYGLEREAAIRSGRRIAIVADESFGGRAAVKRCGG